MNIRVTQGSNRKMAWTDRKGGYLELMTALAGSAHGGYFREGRRLLSDFFISFDRDGENDLFRANALYTDVSPHGFSAAFEHGDATLSLDVSLLIDERAFYIGLRHSSGSVPPFINPGFMLDGAPGGDDRSRSDPAWRVAEAGGFTACDDGCGAAIASARPFTVSENAEGLVCLRAPSDGAHAPSAVWYLAFEETPEKARAKALSLAVGDAILAHRKKIDAFLAGCAGVSDDGRFDSAVHWARFSAWMMVAPIGGASAQELGFMAGLPCAGERDARDSFISLSGALLVSGRFAEAACVLRAFSRRQEKNPVSPSYGRIPSRIAADGSLAFDGADATLWFIRALWEYLQYTADLTLAEELAPAVDLAISAALERRVDEFGFLRHGEGETWMDAIGGDGLLRTPRGDRASEVQALWYTALRVGARLSDFRGDAPRAATLNAEAVRVRDSFRAFFGAPNAVPSRTISRRVLAARRFGTFARVRIRFSRSACPRFSPGPGRATPRS